jgi:hypothetical protein
VVCGSVWPCAAAASNAAAGSAAETPARGLTP